MKLKRFIAAAVALSLAGGALPAAYDTIIPALTASAEASSGTMGETITWTLDTDGTLTISGEGDIPDHDYDSTPFYMDQDIKNVIIEDGITSIGNFTFFSCSELVSIAIPDSVTSIGEYAFECCQSLDSITVPDSATSIGEYAFEFCQSLKIITIPASVTSIGDQAFSYCGSLESIVVDENNQFYKTIGGVLFDKSVSKLICYPAGKTDTSYTIPDTVTSIGDGAFMCCKSLGSVVMPDTVIDIGANAFFECSKLASITIPDSVADISEGAFARCASLVSVTIPASVTSIDDWSFSYCTSLRSITILNPDCEIANSNTSICSGYDDDSQKHYFNGTIYSYENSKAQAYAEKYGYSFRVIGDEPEPSFGDFNADGFVDSADASLILVYNADGTELSVLQVTAGDINGDGLVDPVDASLILAYNAYVAGGGERALTEWLTAGTPITDSPAASDDDYSDECAILANMYAKGYVPVGTYSGSYVVEDPSYGIVLIFNGANKNGGSGTYYSAPYDYTEDSLLESPSMRELQSLAHELWDNGTVSDIMSGTNIRKYDFDYAYFIAAIMSGDYQYSGAILAPIS